MRHLVSLAQGWLELRGNAPAADCRSRTHQFDRTNSSCKWLLLALAIQAPGCGENSQCIFQFPSGGGATSSSVTAAGGSMSIQPPAAGGASELGEPSASSLSITAAALGDGYHFVDTAAGSVLMLAADGPGPPLVVALRGCDSTGVFPLPAFAAGWHVRDLVGDATGGTVVWACGLSSCALFDDREVSENQQFRLVPGSEALLGPWERLRVSAVDGNGTATNPMLCVYSDASRSCFVEGSWTDPLRSDWPQRVHAFEPPACGSVELVAYTHNMGATSDGRLVRVDNRTTAPERCIVVSEPLGPTLLLYEYSCGISSNLWLVTTEMVFREVLGDGCDCVID